MQAYVLEIGLRSEQHRTDESAVQLERAVQLLRDRGEVVPDSLLEHVSPLAWEHINLTGDYVWRSRVEGT